MKNRLIAIGVFGVAMGFLEAAVVVYLRLQYYPDGFSFPLAAIPAHIVMVEVAREAATIMMLATVGWIAGKRLLERFGYFALAFGVWDIFYYVFLKLILGWPASLLTEDILFLIPVPWISPVLAPILVSLCLIGASIVVLYRESTGSPVTIGIIQWVFICLGGTLMLVSFLLDTGAAFHQQLPAQFNWFLFATGILVGMASFVATLK